MGHGYRQPPERLGLRFSLGLGLKVQVRGGLVRLRGVETKDVARAKVGVRVRTLGLGLGLG